MHILVTGAAGLIGSELAALLAAAGHSVTALVHSNSALVRSDRTAVATLPWNGLTPAAASIAVVKGDVSRPLIGLADNAYRTLASSLDLAVHCAAVTQFALDPDIYQRVNVGGTANIIELARSGSRGPVPMVHVSTAYVCGNRNGSIAEDDAILPEGFANGYEASKAAGERLIQAARRGGMKIAVARPSIVVGDSRNGAIQHFCDVYRFIRLVAQGQITSLPARAGATLDFVPIDHVARGIAEIAERIDEAAGQNFHLVSGSPIPVEQFTQALAAFPQFRAVDLLPPENFQIALLPRSEQRLHRQVAHLYGSYLQRDPRFLDTNFRRLSGRTCPPTDSDYFMQLLRFGIDTGFFRSENALMLEAA